MPTPSSYTIQSLVSTLEREATVAELIDEETGGWNHALVRETFNKGEADVVYAVPIIGMGLEDKLIGDLLKMDSLL